MKLVVLILFIFGCATKEGSVFVDQVSPELVETFKIENKKFAKFVVEKKAPPKKKIEIKKKKKMPVSVKVKASKTKLVLHENNTVKSQEIKKQKEEPEVDTLPEGYPEELIELDKESQKTWENYTPFYRIGEELIFSISYLGITAGKIRFTTEGGLKIAGQDALHFRAVFKTSRFYKYIYEADDQVETYVSADKFLPIKYSLVQRESSKDVDDLQLFDQEERKTYLFYKRFKKKNKQITKTEKEAFLSKYYQDFMSTIFFVRGLDLKKGDLYSFPVFTRGKYWRLKIKVADTNESIKVMGKWRKAIRLDAIALPPKSDKKKKRSTISFWYSNDSERVFLKLKAKLKFGSIEGELEEYTPGRMP